MARKNENGLTDKQQAFADLYRGGPEAIRGNAKACYKEIYPRSSARTSEVEGAKLLRKPEIVAYLDQKREETSELADVTEQRWLTEVSRIAFFDPRKLFDSRGNILPVTEWPDEVAAALASVEVSRRYSAGKPDDYDQITKVRFWEKGKHLEMIGKYLKVLVDKSEHEVKAPGIEQLLKEISGVATSSPMGRVAEKIARGED
jgi:phage terminase small subunit